MRSLPESELFQLKISAVPLTRFPAVEDQLKASSVPLPGTQKNYTRSSLPNARLLRLQQCEASVPNTAAAATLSTAGVRRHGRTRADGAVF
ncbi:uncharacterized [Tachysurus ichikawai]